VVAAALELVVEEEGLGAAEVEVGEVALTEEVVVDGTGPLAPGKMNAQVATAAARRMTIMITAQRRRRARFRRRRSLWELGERYRPGSSVMILLERSGEDPL
jgi:hypothetical protein